MALKKITYYNGFFSNYKHTFCLFVERRAEHWPMSAPIFLKGRSSRDSKGTDEEADSPRLNSSLAHQS